MATPTQEEFEKARDEAIALAHRIDQFMSEAQIPMRIAEMAITLLVAKLVTVATERDWRTNLHLFAEGVDAAISEREAAARCLN